MNVLVGVAGELFVLLSESLVIHTYCSHPQTCASGQYGTTETVINSNKESVQLLLLEITTGKPEELNNSFPLAIISSSLKSAKTSP